MYYESQKSQTLFAQIKHVTNKDSLTQYNTHKIENEERKYFLFYFLLKYYGRDEMLLPHKLGLE